MVAKILRGFGTIGNDQPVPSFDPLGREEMLALVARLGGLGISVLLATHLLDDVQQVCEHVIMLDGGRLVVSGATGSLLEGTAALTLDEGVYTQPLLVRRPVGPPVPAQVHGGVELQNTSTDTLEHGG